MKRVLLSIGVFFTAAALAAHDTSHRESRFALIGHG